VLASCAAAPTARETSQGQRPLDLNEPTLPVQLAGRPPEWTEEPRRADAHGHVVARCTLTEHGMLVGCVIVESESHLLDAMVLASLATRRYTPTMYRGRPTRASYTFPFCFTSSTTVSQGAADGTCPPGFACEPRMLGADVAGRCVPDARHR
jgi:hypothetical protein